jgi:hypothetical protein
MKVINVYEQYFAAELEFQGVERRAALVMLTASSDAGTIRYEAGVTFFPHRDEADYAVSYDAWFSRELYAGKGRRSKKREEKLLETFREEIDSLAAEAGGRVFWDRPLRPEKRA